MTLCVLEAVQLSNPMQKLPPPHAPSAASEAAQNAANVGRTKRAARMIMCRLPSMEAITRVPRKETNKTGGHCS
ncbi:hypothetical protein BN2476_680170 [Paraburkholderia piptadeniae]|uniref:Uncharacterized protein n=1 Tax=Paraburkholderia piptadeniae TaxID=1701573 RepID=A0A1N7SQ77_9BURK|nr:hypothetical protein BN2476_680170 [Paraburkholderia piptadeniae]